MLDLNVAIRGDCMIWQGLQAMQEKDSWSQIISKCNETDIFLLHWMAESVRIRHPLSLKNLKIWNWKSRICNYDRHFLNFQKTHLGLSYVRPSK